MIKKMKTVILIGAIGILCGIQTSSGADWPQWGGTDVRNMASSEKGLPDWFDCGKENADSYVDMATTKNVKWVAELGPRTSGSPVVSHGKVFIGSTVPGNLAALYCFDEQTGRELGVFICQKPKKENFARCMEGGSWGVVSTPTIEGDRIYFVSPYQQVICLDMNIWLGKENSASANGNTSETSDKCIVWKYDLAKELKSVQMHVASCSVLVHGDFLYVCTGNERHQDTSQPYFPLMPSFVALNKKTGQLAARDDEQIGERLWRAQWSSPSMGVVNNKAQIYFGAGDGVCYAFEPADPNIMVQPNRWTTTTLRGPIIQFVNVGNSQPSVSGSSARVATNSPVPSTPSSAVPVETRYSIGLPVCSPLDSVPTEKVPDVPLLKKIWWFDCIPEDYKKNPFYAGSARGDGKGRPCEITATPVFYRNRVYLAIGGDPVHGGAGSKGHLVCIDATKTGNITKTGCIWSYDKINQSISTVAIADGLVYAMDESRGVHCLDADTGQCYWTSHGGTGYNSPLLVDGKLFVGGSVLAAGKELKLLSTEKPLTPNMLFSNYSTPCAANGVLFTVIGKRLWAICDKGDKK